MAKALPDGILAGGTADTKSQRTDASICDDGISRQPVKGCSIQSLVECAARVSKRGCGRGLLLLQATQPSRCLHGDFAPASAVFRVFLLAAVAVLFQPTRTDHHTAKLCRHRQQKGIPKAAKECS